MLLQNTENVPHTQLSFNKLPIPMANTNRYKVFNSIMVFSILSEQLSFFYVLTVNFNIYLILIYLFNLFNYCNLTNLFNFNYVKYIILRKECMLLV